MEKDQNITIEKNKNEDKIHQSEENSTNLNKESSIDLNKESSIDLNKEKPKELSLEEKFLELEDKLTRTLAEMENQRRRFEKENEDAFDYGGFAFAREALNLIDNLDRSKQSLQNDNSLKDSEALKKILEHIDIINKDLLSIFTKNNIMPIDSINKKMDPNFHQAMMEIEDDQKEAGTIVQEIQKGFMMKNRLLRPALVGVSKKSANKEPKSEENQDKVEIK